MTFVLASKTIVAKDLSSTLLVDSTCHLRWCTSKGKTIERRVCEVVVVSTYNGCWCPRDKVTKGVVGLVHGRGGHGDGVFACFHV